MSTRVEFVVGDITEQGDIDAVVNAANAELAPGGGVAGAIHRSAGPELYEEAKAYAPLDPGMCAITDAYDLPNIYVIHCLGPRYGIDEPADQLLASCYMRALKAAEYRSVSSVAFPALSTGAFGFPLERAATVTARALREATTSLKEVKLVRLVLARESDRAVFEAAWKSAK